MSTQKGEIKCARWLEYCLSIGWDKSQLDKLQEIWNKYHDEHGNLRSEVESRHDSREQKEISEQIKGLIYLNCGHLDSGGYYLDDKKIDEAAKDLFDFFKESLTEKQSRIDELEAFIETI